MVDLPSLSFTDGFLLQEQIPIFLRRAPHQPVNVICQAFAGKRQRGVIQASSLRPS